MKKFYFLYLFIDYFVLYYILHVELKPSKTMQQIRKNKGTKVGANIFSQLCIIL